MDGKKDNIAGLLDRQEKQKDGWMDIKNVWIERKMVGWINGQMDGWMDRKNRWMDGWIEKIDGYKNGRLDGQKKWMVGWIKNRWMVGWMDRKNRWLDGQKR